MKRKETPPMGKHRGNRSEKSRVTYEVLEEVVRMKVQELIQDILEKEITEFLGRRKSERIRKKVDTCCGYRNGYGKPRRLALMNGTIRIRRPRLRNTKYRGLILINNVSIIIWTEHGFISVF